MSSNTGRARSPGISAPRRPEALAAFGVPLGEGEPLVGDIMRAAAEATGVSDKQFCSPLRSRATAVPRQAAMWVAFHLTCRSLPAIGRRFGDRDHTTVLHAIRVTERRLAAPESSRAMADLVAGILLALSRRPARSQIVIGAAATVPSPRAVPPPIQVTKFKRSLPVARIDRLRRDRRSVRGIAWLLGLPPADVAAHLGVEGRFATGGRS